ncbi:ERVV2 protein, partial [Nyctibius grandis]|nr:ERVV2 protein [Nyctibius grandis]
TVFHSFARRLLPWLGVSELEKALVNISAATEILGNNNDDAVMELQEEVSQLPKIMLQNRMALDTLLASQGGVCTIINTGFCMYVNQCGRISADVQ